jgi:hypothetical protein
MSDHIGLHAAHGTEWCGPTAIAAVIGCSPADAERAILKHRETTPPPRSVQLQRAKRGHAVKGTTSAEIAPACALLGWNAIEEMPRTPRETFARWLRRKCVGPHIVLITGHFVAVSGDMFVDTSFRTPVRAAAAIRLRRSRKRVVRVWKLSPIQQEQ